MSVPRLEPVLTASWDQPDAFTLAGYERGGGYRAMRSAFELHPDDVISRVSDSGLRGRGGSGFPTGQKWSLVPKADGKPHYLVVNADESEPGACKDIPLIMANPHLLIEGTIISAYAIGASHAFIYVRGEVLHPLRRLREAVAEAYRAGYLGSNILGSGFDLELIVYAGAGAYICGEETALLDSLEGYRGQPRLRPPFPATQGLYALPTVVNNVETIASIPGIVARGAEWFAGLGTGRSKGHAMFSVSGHVNRPGQYEAALGITLRELIEMSGGMRNGNRLKFWVPGGSSSNILTAEHLDVPMTFEDLQAAGSALGSRSIQIFDETTCVVRAVLRWSEFYMHESCGKCTPCREGTYWMTAILRRLQNGAGCEQDLTDLLDICQNIDGRAFCALGDLATCVVRSSVNLFREEYLAHLAAGHCPFNPADANFWRAGTS